MNLWNLKYSKIFIKEAHYLYNNICNVSIDIYLSTESNLPVLVFAVGTFSDVSASVACWQTVSASISETEK